MRRKEMRYFRADSPLKQSAYILTPRWWPLASIVFAVETNQLKTLTPSTLAFKGTHLVALKF